ncbi:MAG: aldo/keto reductase, partial [Verrucomicrobia bacterium]|nr:aldo/keto reductase [Verrucomicrobiota bacterium]
MEFVKIAGTDLTVSRIGLGTWAIGGWMWGGSDEAASLATIHAAIDHGINLIDTAPAYGYGRSEEIVGKAVGFSGLRDKIVIATKGGVDWSNGPPFDRASRKNAFAEVEGSLRRLRTDYIDIYQVQWPDPLLPFGEWAEAMGSLLKQGKIRAIGVSNFSRQQIHDFRQITGIHTVHSTYNLFEREIEDEVLPYCRSNAIAMLACGPLCRGLLSGQMRPDTTFIGDDLRRSDPKFQPPRYSQYLNTVARLDRLAHESYRRGVLHLALRWVLDQPGVTVAIWGARQPQQLDSIGEVMGWSLDEDVMRE